MRKAIFSKTAVLLKDWKCRETILLPSCDSVNHMSGGGRPATVLIGFARAQQRQLQDDLADQAVLETSIYIGYIAGRTLAVPMYIGKRRLFVNEMGSFSTCQER